VLKLLFGYRYCNALCLSVSLYCLVQYLYFLMVISLRIVCKTGAMADSKEGPVIANIGEAVILWETPFRYQVASSGY